MSNTRSVCAVLSVAVGLTIAATMAGCATPSPDVGPPPAPALPEPRDSVAFSIADGVRTRFYLQLTPTARHGIVTLQLHREIEVDERLVWRRVATMGKYREALREATPPLKSTIGDGRYRLAIYGAGFGYHILVQQAAARHGERDEPLYRIVARTAGNL